MIIMNKEITFIKYNGIEGYIEVMKHDVEPLNDPNSKGIDLLYDGKDIKAVLDYITNLQQIEQEHKKINGELRKEINKLTAESTEWESKYYETQDNFHNANEEIERLNNIINELEKWLEENESFDDYCNETTFTSVLDKLQDLQGSEDNERKN